MYAALVVPRAQRGEIGALSRALVRAEHDVVAVQVAVRRAARRSAAPAVALEHLVVAARVSWAATSRARGRASPRALAPAARTPADPLDPALHGGQHGAEQLRDLGTGAEEEAPAPALRRLRPRSLWRSRASAADSAPRVAAAGWPTPPPTSSIACSPRCRSASECSRSPTRFATAVPTIAISPAKCSAHSCDRSSPSCGGAFAATGTCARSSAAPSPPSSASARR